MTCSPLRILCGLLIASTGFAQTLAPKATTGIGARSAPAGGAAVTVDLSQNFAIDGQTAQLVRFDSALGRFDVMMRPDKAPNHVTNFLRYVDASIYDNTILHRSAKFPADTNTTRWSIIQGGGFTAVAPPGPGVTLFSPIALEYNLPNARGTLAAARTNDVNSATSQWYFNVADNSETLGAANGGGYSVYGQVIGNGMTVVDLLATINAFNYGNFVGIPLRFYPGSGVPTLQNLTIINRVFRINTYPTSNDSEAALTFTATSSNPAVVAAAINGSTLSLTPGQLGTATITVRAAGIQGAFAEQTFTFTTGGLQITTSPVSQNVAPGDVASMFVTASTTSGNLSFQWYFYRSGMSEPTAIPGAVTAGYVVTNAQPANMGSYFVRVSNGSASVDSAVALVTLTGGTSRLANLSTRGRIAAGGSLTPGFVLSGNGSKPLVVRSVGPWLSTNAGLTEALADPKMDIIPLGGSTALVSNDNWGDAANAAALVTTSSSVGAFPLNAGSLDAALLTNVALPNTQGGSGYTVRIQSTTTTASGIALAEVYDPEAIGSSAGLVNVSALGFSGTGIDTLTPGFVIDGSGAKTMLIRVAGPSIAAAPFNVPGTMADPRLRVVPLGQNLVVASNDNWGGTTALKAAFSSTGAFGFAGDGSNDAAVLVRLPPGGYTVVIEGAAGGTGTVLVEAYEVE